VLIDGKATRSCVTPISTVETSEITTLEGLGTRDKLHPLQRAMSNTGQIVRYLTGTEFHALTTADYKFKGDLIRRLGLTAQ
jgi:hypothetical protein